MQHPLDISKKVYANLKHVIEFASCRASNTSSGVNKIKYKTRSTMISSAHFSECETAVVCWNYRNANSLMLNLRIAFESPISAQTLRVGWAKGHKQRRSGEKKERRYTWKLKSKGGPMKSGEGEVSDKRPKCYSAEAVLATLGLGPTGSGRTKSGHTEPQPLLQTSISVMSHPSQQSCNWRMWLLPLGKLVRLAWSNCLMSHS